MTGVDWWARAWEAVQRSEIMALSTVDEDGGSWTSPVQYAVDDDLTFSFMSLPGARHVDNIGRDPRVSLAVYSEPGPPGGNLGLQVRGVVDRPDGARPGWQRFLVRPEELWVFDSRVDRDRHRLPLTVR